MPQRLSTGAGKESDTEWQTRATEAATARVQAFMLEMMERNRASNTKINLSNQIIETLESMVTSLGDELAGLKEKLDDERETAAEVAHQNRRLETSLFLAAMTDKAEATVRLYYQQMNAEISNQALRSVVDRLVDVEEAGTHTHRDRGPIH